MRKTFNLRGAVLAAALVAASATASADNFSATFNFDNLASGSTADSALGSYASLIHFGNGDTVYDTNPDGTQASTFSWYDASSLYGNVQVMSSAAAVSGSNVLYNSNAPILVMFSSAQTISSFSIQQDNSGFGNLQDKGTYMAFLDSTGHEIAGSQSYYTQGGNPGLLLQSVGTFSNVSAVLLSGGVSYDNLSITAVPEPDSWAMLAGGLFVLGAVARRRRA